MINTQAETPPKKAKYGGELLCVALLRPYVEGIQDKEINARNLWAEWVSVPVAAFDDHRIKRMVKDALGSYRLETIR